MIGQDTVLSVMKHRLHDASAPSGQYFNGKHGGEMMNTTQGQFEDSRALASRSRQRINRKLTLAVSIVVLLCGTASSAYTQSPLSGEWKVEFERHSNNVRLTIYSHQAVSGNGTSLLILPAGKLQGLTSAPDAADAVPVSFTLTREAGRFNFEGSINEGRGAGQWTLTPNQNFIASMRRIGYDHLFEHQLLVAAIYDLNLEYIAEMKALGYNQPSIDQLLGARMFNVSINYIKELQLLGLSGVSVDELISLQMFSVTPGYVRELRALGYDRVSPDQLVSMRMNQVTPEYINGLREQGYRNVSVNDLLRMSMFGVNGAYIAELRRNGIKDLTIDQLVGRRFYNVR
jgi:hypothetical protein